MATPAERAASARAWYHACQERPCEEVLAWEYGTVVRTRRHPDFYFHNGLRVERATPLDAAELVAEADRLLGSRCHQITFEDLPEAERLREPLEARGWVGSAAVLMLHEGVRPEAVAAAAVAEVPYDRVEGLRVAWHREDFPGVDPTAFLASRREIHLAGPCTVLAAPPHGDPAGFAELIALDDRAEISSVYVAPEHRRRGLGTQLTRAAIERGLESGELWIGAEAAGPAREIYERLGFRAAWEVVDFTLPGD